MKIYFIFFLIIFIWCYKYLYFFIYNWSTWCTKTWYYVKIACFLRRGSSTVPAKRSTSKDKWIIGRGIDDHDDEVGRPATAGAPNAPTNTQAFRAQLYALLAGRLAGSHKPAPCNCNSAALHCTTDWSCIALVALPGVTTNLPAGCSSAAGSPALQ